MIPKLRECRPTRDNDTQDGTGKTSRVQTQYTYSLKLLTLLIMENMQYPNCILSVCSHGYRQHTAMFWPFRPRNLTERGPFEKQITA